MRRQCGIGSLRGGSGEGSYIKRDGSLWVVLGPFGGSAYTGSRGDCSQSGIAARDRVPLGRVRRNNLNRIGR